MYVAVGVLLAVLYLIIGFCTFCTEFVSDLQLKLRSFSDLIVNAKDNILTIDECTEIKKKFIDFIQFHSEAKELWLQWIFH